MSRDLPHSLIVVIVSFVVLACLCVIAAGASAVRDKASPRDKSRRMLALVERWGCQYQNIDPQRIAGSSLDLVVVDPIVDGSSGRTAAPETVRLMQLKPDGGRRLVLAYLSVGAAEEYRPYWNPDWAANPPAWLGPSSPDWPRSHSVRYWLPEWQRLVADGLQKIIAAGFDGIFLDRVDAYGDWREVRASALEDMAGLVSGLTRAARRQQPGFLVIGQNAEHLLPLARYRASIDGVSKESLLTGLQGEGTPNRPDQIAWSMNYLVPAQKAGLRMLAIEYLHGDAAVEAARAQHLAAGFVPFFGHRLLDRLP